MEIRLVLLDTDARRAAALRQAMTAASIRMDIDYRLLTITEPHSLAAHNAELRRAHILLMARSFPDAAGIGERLSILNPALIIGFHDELDFAIGSEMLKARPFIAAQTAAGHDPSAYIDSLIGRFRIQTALFRWDSRFTEICIPCKDILYFSSYNRYVSIVTLSGESGKLNSTLDSVQAQVDESLFLRIHKSYLVNRFAVTRIDKSRRQAVLRNTEMLPISDSRYEEVLNRIFPDSAL